MGLDSYLYAEKYLSGYSFVDDEERAAYQQILNSAGMQALSNEASPHVEVKLCVAYWRKANAIHDWFVKNVQDGVDECQTSYVPHEKLEELRNTADVAITMYESGNKEAAAKLLPPASGFFFGSTDVDGYYLQDLKNTVEQIDRVLPSAEDYTFYYHSSW